VRQQSTQNLRQLGRAEFTRSTSAMRKLAEAYFVTLIRHAGNVLISASRAHLWKYWA
jgi:hypothetical protein